MPWEVPALALSNREWQRLAGVWLDWYSAAIERAQRPVILGHPLREPLMLGLFSLREGAMLKRVLKRFEQVLHPGVVFEINDAWVGRLAQTTEYEPYVELVRAAKHEGVRFARGSDSHRADDVGRYDGLLRIVADAGLELSDWIDPSAWPGVIK